MVSHPVRIRDKHRGKKKFIKWFLIIVVIFLILVIVFLVGLNKGGKVEIILEHPLKDIIFANTNEQGEVDYDAVLTQGITEFNEDYINYILVALGVGYLHKSPLFENPFIEFDLQGEVWNSEIKKGMPNSELGEIDNEDLRISISKEEAVKALLAEDIEQFMKDSVFNGNTQMEMVAGYTELFSKGYLEMYKELTGEEISAE